MKTMLSIDGGGIMGVGSAVFLRRLEQEYKDLSKFDAYAGTSVGSILATGGALGMSWDSIYTLFNKVVPSIFKKRSFFDRFSPNKYKSSDLINGLKKAFGDKKMTDLSVPLYVMCENFNAGRKPKVFDRTDDIYIWEAVAMSCSAPTYFAPIKGIIDGGLLANCPSMIGLTSVIHKENWSIDDVKILSLGTNGDVKNKITVSSKTRKLGWGKALLSTPTLGGEAIAVFQTNALLGDRVLRIEPMLKNDIDMDDLSKMGDYMLVWETLYIFNSTKVEEFLR